MPIFSIVDWREIHIFQIPNVDSVDFLLQKYKNLICSVLVHLLMSMGQRVLKGSYFSFKENLKL